MVAMKPSVVALLVMVAYVEQVHSMWCLQCENEPSNWNCLRPVKCAEDDKYCITTTKTLLSGEAGYRINKRCSRVCDDTKVNRSLEEASTKCCDFNICNVSGAISVKTSTAVTALGMLTSFFYIFRSVL